MSEPKSAILATNLCKRFGKVFAVSNFDLVVEPGEAIGILGPNGAGKSTTVDMLMGLLRPDSGGVEIFGHPVNQQNIRKLVGATPQATSIPDQLTPREVFSYTAERYEVSLNIEPLVEAFGLVDLLDRRVQGFSGGEMRRVGLALAFVGNPRLVFLDEPTSGLDPDARKAFYQFARNFVAQSGSIVLTSHHWEEIDAVCTSIVLIESGEKVLSGRLEDIRKKTNIKRVEFTLPGDMAPPEWAHAVKNGDFWQIKTNSSDSIVKRLILEDVPIDGLSVAPLDLQTMLEYVREEVIAQ